MRLVYGIILLLLWFRGANAVTCTDPAASSYTSSNAAFTSSSNMWGIDVYNLEFGSSSGDFYMYGLIQEFSNDYMFVRRMTTTLTQVYAYTYPILANANAFTVDSLENYFYIVIPAGYKIFEINATDGSVSAAKTNAALTNSGSYSRLSPLPGTAGIFFTNLKTVDNNLYCRWPGGSAQIECIKIGASVTNYYGISIDADRWFYHYFTGGSHYIYKADFTDPNVNIWASTFG